MTRALSNYILLLILCCSTVIAKAEGDKEKIKTNVINSSSDGISLEPILKMVNKDGDSLKSERIKQYAPKIIALFDSRYYYDESLDVNNSFSIARARLGIKGNLYKDITYKLFADFAGTPKLLDGYINYKPLEQFGLQFGQFKVPTSLENHYSTLKYETIEATHSFSRLMGFSDSLRSSVDDRDIGAFAFGGFFKRDGYSILNYKIGVVNGSGKNTKDTNNNKNFFAVAIIRPTKELTLLGSFSHGIVGTMGVSEYLYQRWVGGLQYTSDKLMVRSEYIRGRTGELKSDGFYTATQVALNGHFAAVAKYDIFRYSTTSRVNNESYYTAGLTYLLGSHIRAQINYTYVDTYTGHYNMAGLQLKFGF